MIRILNVRIQNLLSFKSEALVKDAYPISVFVGANNAGKSNLIRAMFLYQNLLHHYKNKRETYSIRDEYYHRLGRNELSTISIRYKFEDKNFSNHPLVVDHFILFNYQGYFDKEGFSLMKENGEEIRVIKKENSKTFIKRRELVGDFLFDAKSGYVVGNPESGFEEVPIGFHVPFFWPENDDSPGIRIFDEIKRYIESWIFISADRLIEIDKRVKDLQTQVYKKIRASSNLINDMCKLVGVSDLNFDEIGGKLTSIISDGPDISVGLAGQGSGLQEIFTMHPQIYEGSDKVFFIEEPEVHLHALLQRKLLQIFAKRSQTNQFFITTQSPIFCRFQKDRIKPYLVKKEAYNTSIRELGEDDMTEIKSVLGHVNTDLFGYNAVLFVEGNSEFKTIPLLAGDLNIDVVNDGIRIVDSEGYGNMKQIKNIIELLEDNGTRVYALSDNHSSKHGRLNDIRNRLGNNHTELQKDFEDSFDIEILINALQAILQEEKRVLSDSEIRTLRTNLSSPTASAFAILRDKYQQRSPSKLSKVRLGESIANALHGSQYLEKSEPEKLIRKIRDRVVQQMDLEL